MALRVAVNQSNYLPWKGYFDIIREVDLFIFYDDVSFTKNDWRNRNKIKTPKGSTWITIPTGATEKRLICEVAIPPGNWASLHWHLIEQHYSSSPHFQQFAPFFRAVLLERTWSTLSELNQFLIRSISLEFLQINTQISDSRNYQLDGKKQDRLLQLLKTVGATEYLSGPAGIGYLDPHCFSDAGIRLVWKDYSGYPEYPQSYPPFVHSVSIIDLLFNVGSRSPDYIWGWRPQASAGRP